MDSTTVIQDFASTLGGQITIVINAGAVVVAAVIKIISLFRRRK